MSEILSQEPSQEQKYTAPYRARRS